MDSHLIGALILPVIWGTLCGLFPYFVGKKRGQPTLGFVGLVACIVAGPIAGIILALPVAWAFAIIISLRREQSARPLSGAASYPGRGPAPAALASCRHHFTWITQPGASCDVCSGPVSGELLSEDRGKFCEKCTLVVHVNCQHQLS